MIKYDLDKEEKLNKICFRKQMSPFMAKSQDCQDHFDIIEKSCHEKWPTGSSYIHYLQVITNVKFVDLVPN